MDATPPRKKDWVLTRESLDKLLICLDPDRERAGEKYENLRRTLVSFFEWRGCPFPEEQADETLNRAARKLGEGTPIHNLQGYCYGVARRLALELAQQQSREAQREELSDDLPAPSAGEEGWERERRLECFEHCLRSLPVESQVLIIQYYQAEKRAKIDNRAKLAQRLSIPLNTLRVRAYRIREQLDACIANCLRQPLRSV
jgi:RNA polymerase sigma factor (sigma-70 family)